MLVLQRGCTNIALTSSIAASASTASKGGLLAVIRTVFLDVTAWTVDKLNMWVSNHILAFALRADTKAIQARIPNADGSVMKAPEGVDEKYLVLMGDIFPTGWFAANNAFKNSTPEQIAEQTVVLIGCGPVGLCALINALEYKPKHILAVDSVPSRLELAKSLGAEPWNFQLDRAGLDKRVHELTNGRGADAVIEVVGLSPALRTGYDLLRPWGTISSVGVHNGEVIRCGSGFGFSIVANEIYSDSLGRQ